MMGKELSGKLSCMEQVLLITLVQEDKNFASWEFLKKKKNVSELLKNPLTFPGLFLQEPLF